MLRALLPGMLFIFMACGGSNADATGSAGSGAETDLGTGGGDSGGGAAGGAQGSGGRQDVGGGPPLGPEFCPTGAAVNGVGIDVGQRLPEIMVKRCDGSDVSLSDFCGAEGLWIFAAHGWCPLCQSVSRNQESLHDEFAGRGLVTLNIVMETASLEAPGPEFCALWRSEHGHEDVVTLFDPTGATLALWPGGSSSLSAFVDADRTITGKLVHDSNLTTIRAGIEESLKP